MGLGRIRPPAGDSEKPRRQVGVSRSSAQVSGAPGWAEARTAWWNMLQAVGSSDGSVEAITAAVDQYVNQANGK